MIDNMVKKEYRTYMLEVKPYVNYSNIAKKVGLTKQSISVFLKDEYHLGTLSIDKLQEIKRFIEGL